MRYDRFDWITLCMLACVWLLALLLHTSSALLAGLAAFGLTRWLLWGRGVERIPGAQVLIAILLALSPFILVRVISDIFGSHFTTLVNETVGLWHRLLDEAMALRDNIPEAIRPAIPDTPEMFHKRLMDLLTSRSAELFEVGRHGVGMLVHTIFGWWLGIAAAFGQTVPTSGPLLRAWHRRWQALAIIFGRVARGQCWVALANTIFATLFLFIVAPIAGWAFPFKYALILITFSASLIPVAGNLICNTLLLLVGLGVSLSAGIGALVFMVIVHKAEYLVSARILGNANRVAAWELIAAMITGEILFGPVGLISMTVLYPYFKHELREAGLI
ncbi:MAG: hypothetical protein JO142_12880 [Burkholderiales bacterium]|nr:hypothetical protein [Burkholderiales bacterium]